MKKIGFIGCGNMATAMIAGLMSTSSSFSNIYVHDHDLAKMLQVQNDYGVVIANSNIDVVNNVDVVILAVKPNVYKAVIDEIKDVVKEELVIVSIAAGMSLENITNLFGKKLKFVRSMPNTPALVNEGMTALCFSSLIVEDEKQLIKGIFSSFGKYVVLKEDKFDAYTAICGSSPAFVYLFIEALADGGVLEGLPRSQVYDMVSQAVLGSAKMVLETKMHPGVLKDNVCSPGGTTIEGVFELENSGFRSSVMKAVKRTTEKSKEMNKKK